MMDLAQPEDYAVGTVVKDDRGPAIQTFSGTYFHILDPRPEDVHLADIAHALSHLCRYTGHVRDFYSVAQHSVIVSRLVPEAYALQGLLHDAAEAYIGDVSRPLKMAFNELAPHVLKDIEWRIEGAILKRFGLQEAPHTIIKHADNVALATEKREFMHRGTAWPNMPEPAPERIVPLTPFQAKTAFMKRYIEITEMR